MVISFSNIWNKFLGVKEITIDKIIKGMDKTPKRISFGTTHKNACRRVSFDGNEAVGAIFVPFENSLKEFLKTDTGLEIIKTKKGSYWCPANTEDEFIRLKDFVEKYKRIVFLRDNLESSIALSMNRDDDDRTEIGELEYQAKYNDSEKATLELVELVLKFINSTNVYNGCTFVCAVPPSKRGEENLPAKIAKGICSGIKDKINISNDVQWKKNKPSLKELKVNEKLATLEQVGLDINVEDIEGKNMILIDDLYQSGSTMQFVAMKLKEAGASKVYGISLVKSRRNTDNL